MSSKTDLSLTAERVRELLEYHRDGYFIRRITVNKRHQRGDKVMGYKNDQGYVLLGIDSAVYRMHRVVWLYMHGAWPSAEIDHINRVRDDNRIENLRDVTPAENKQNTGMKRSNTSGFKGIVFLKRDRLWRADIRANGERVRLGCFKSKIDAATAYAKAAEQLHTCAPRMETSL